MNTYQARFTVRNNNSKLTVTGKAETPEEMLLKTKEIFEKAIWKNLRMTSLRQITAKDSTEPSTSPKKEKSSTQGTSKTANTPTKQ